MTQHEKIANYIKRFGSITPMDAFADLGITKLATRISEMRRMGIEIRDEWTRTKNRFGERVEYKRYYF